MERFFVDIYKFGSLELDPEFSIHSVVFAISNNFMFLVQNKEGFFQIVSSDRCKLVTDHL